MKQVLLILALPWVQGAAEDLRPGLLGEYYNIGEEFDDFPALGNRAPTTRLIDAEIKFQRTTRAFGRTDLSVFFCVRWSGRIQIDKAGKCMFYLASDDGSRLLVDGKLVVNNGGLHGYEVTVRPTAPPVPPSVAA